MIRGTRLLMSMQIWMQTWRQTWRQPPISIWEEKCPKREKIAENCNFFLCRQPFLQYRNGNRKAFTYYQPPRTITRLQLRRFSRTRVTHARIPWQFRLFAFTTFTMTIVFLENVGQKGVFRKGLDKAKSTWQGDFC